MVTTLQKLHRATLEGGNRKPGSHDKIVNRINRFLWECCVAADNFADEHNRKQGLKPRGGDFLEVRKAELKRIVLALPPNIKALIIEFKDESANSLRLTEIIRALEEEQIEKILLR